MTSKIKPAEPPSRPRNEASQHWSTLKMCIWFFVIKFQKFLSPTSWKIELPEFFSNFKYIRRSAYQRQSQLPPPATHEQAKHKVRRTTKLQRIERACARPPVSRFPWPSCSVHRFNNGLIFPWGDLEIFIRGHPNPSPSSCVRASLSLPHTP